MTRRPGRVSRRSPIVSPTPRLFDRDGPGARTQSCRRTAPVRMAVAHQRTGVGTAAVCYGARAVGRHHVQIEIDQTLAADGSAGRAHAVRGVAHRTTESI